MIFHAVYYYESEEPSLAQLSMHINQQVVLAFKP
jgi:hypothetical protein